MRFSVTVLGTNAAVPSATRHCSAHFLRSETTDVLIDCGEGTQTQLSHAGLSMGRVGLILITHLHGDHYFGLPGLITSLALTGRIMPLRIISPPGLRDKLAPLLELDRWRLPFSLVFEEFVAEDYGPLTETGELEIFSFPLRHRIATNGYLIREKQRPANIRKEAIAEYNIPYQLIPGIKEGGDLTLDDGKIVAHSELTAPAAPPRAYAYCSDTVYFPELAGYVKNVDLLYHEATFLSDMTTEAMEKGHSTAAQAATTAASAGAKRLIMGHFSARYGDLTPFEAEARAIFPESYAARDLYVYEVPYAGRE